jgi:hypothetical protein
MSRIQQGIRRIISTSLVDGRLVLQLRRDRQVRAAISDGVLIEQDSGCQCLNRVRDVLVVPG